ncbi:MAG: hypothetical protein AAGA92_09540 [Planctomycetota bacterium]
MAVLCLGLLTPCALAQPLGRGAQRNLQAQPNPQAPFGSNNLLRRPRGLAAATNEPPIALQGFCPVSLRDRQIWQDGDRRITAVLDGQTYRLSGEREYDRFVAAPLRYAPALGGDCPVAFVETGERTVGAVQYGLIHAGRPYFFASDEHRERFRSDPGRFEQADLALAGHCPVRWLDTKRRVAGREETTIVVAGIRYRFAGMNEQQRFVASPADYLMAGPQPSWALHGASAGSSIAQAVNPFRDPHLAGSGQRSSNPTSLPTGSSTRQDLAPAPTPEPQDLASTTPSEADSEPMLTGFCPVSIIDDPDWKKGLEDIFTTYDGRLYLFASEAKRDKFISDPYLYVPALRGACVVTYAREETFVNGSVHRPMRCPKTGRLYLLAGETEGSAFEAEPSKFLDLDLFQSGTCIVTLVEEGKPTEGNPLIGTWLRGMRYVFTSVDKRERFLAAPEDYLASAGDVLPATALEQSQGDEGPGDAEEQ